MRCLWVSCNSLTDYVHRYCEEHRTQGLTICAVRACGLSAKDGLYCVDHAAAKRHGWGPFAPVRGDEAETYLALREQLSSDDAVASYLAERLRTLAAHVESKRAPYVLGVSRALVEPVEPRGQGEVIEDYVLVLSHPWGA